MAADAVDDDARPLTLSREDLYELAWSKSVSELAKDFGISDVALAKRCRRLRIPLPGRGYWARVDAGQPPHRPKLLPRQPRLQDQSALTVTRSDSPPVSRAEPDSPESTGTAQDDAQWLKERIEFDERRENAIEVEAIVRCWHPAVSTIRETLEAAAADMRASRRAAERYEKWPEWRKRREGSDKSWKWRWVKDRGQRLTPRHKPAALKVSLDTYQRALGIANALAFAAVNRGFTVREDTEGRRLLLTGYRATIQLRITEPLENKTRPTKSYTSETKVEQYQVPTGRLRITLGLWHDEGPNFEDRASCSLEAQLNRLFVSIYRLVVKVWAEQRKREARERCYEEERKRHEEEKRLKAEMEKALAEERARRKRLALEANRWVLAERVRDYVSHIREHAGCPNDSLSAWTNWALQVAFELDPTTERLQSSRSGNSEGA